MERKDCLPSIHEQEVLELTPSAMASLVEGQMRLFRREACVTISLP